MNALYVFSDYSNRSNFPQNTWSPKYSIAAALVSTACFAQLLNTTQSLSQKTTFLRARLHLFTALQRWCCSRSPESSITQVSTTTGDHADMLTLYLFSSTKNVRQKFILRNTLGHQQITAVTALFIYVNAKKAPIFAPLWLNDPGINGDCQNNNLIEYKINV